MSHLSTERLAALADEQPDAAESSHLAHCAECARELDAIRSLVSLAGAERESLSVPLTRWNTLAAKLRSEGLIAEGGGRSEEGGVARRTHYSMRLLQAAAALLLIVGGVAAGRASAGASLVPGGLSGTERQDVVPTTFASTADAARWQEIFSSGYQRSLEYLASHDTSSRMNNTPATMRTRLSALDQVSRTMLNALNEAPADPVINDLYLSSFAQREATLRQLNTALPQGVRLNSF